MPITFLLKYLPLLLISQGYIDVYLSATVLIAVRLQPALISEISEADIEKSWQRALEILRDCQSDSQSAQRCVAALEILYEKLPSVAQQRRLLQQGQLQQQLVQWPGVGVIDEVQLQAEQDQPAGEMSGYASIIGQGQAGMEDFAFLNPFDMLWLNVLPSTL